MALPQVFQRECQFFGNIEELDPENSGFKPHYAIDIHHQGTYFVQDEEGEDTNEMTTFFRLTGIS